MFAMLNNFGKVVIILIQLLFISKIALFLHSQNLKNNETYISTISKKKKE